jgi:hypothetical protein
VSLLPSWSAPRREQGGQLRGRLRSQGAVSGLPDRLWSDALVLQRPDGEAVGCDEQSEQEIRRHNLSGMARTRLSCACTITLRAFSASLLNIFESVFGTSRCWAACLATLCSRRFPSMRQRYAWLDPRNDRSDGRKSRSSVRPPARLVRRGHRHHPARRRPDGRLKPFRDQTDAKWEPFLSIIPV